MNDTRSERQRFAAMFERLSPAVFAYARRHSDAGTAQDVVADVFLIAWRRRSAVPDEALPWLLVTARHVLANHRRHESRQHRLLDAAGRLEAVASVQGPDHSVVERAAYLAALGRLTETERESLLLVAWDGLTAAQAARVAGCSQRAFEVRLSRARARLGQAFAAESPPEHADRPAPPPAPHPTDHDPEASDLMSSDILDRLAVYAPTPASVAGEWGPNERDQRLGAVLDGSVDNGPTGNDVRRLRFVPTPGALRTRAVAPIAASVAVLVLAGGAAVLADREHGSAGGAGGSGPQTTSPTGAGGTTSPDGAPVFRATVDTPRLRDHQWAYRAVIASSTDTNSRDEQSAAWMANDGSGQRLNPDGSRLVCGSVRAVRDTSFADPTRAFMAQLPTDPAALKAFLVARVQGSTSREEAVFTAAGDLLRAGDLLASSAQRAAFVTVLAGLRRTTVHDDVDDRGRPTVRVDFVDPGQRGNEVQSLYFDRQTFQLLEERNGTLATEPPANAPSAPYTSEPSAQATTPQQLPTNDSIVVVTDERVVDSLPDNCGVAK